MILAIPHLLSIIIFSNSRNEDMQNACGHCILLARSMTLLQVWASLLDLVMHIRVPQRDLSQFHERLCLVADNVSV